MKAPAVPDADPRKQLRAFIARMKQAAPFGDIAWREPMWDATGRLTRAGKRLHIITRDSLWVTSLSENAKQRIPFIAVFDDFAKAIICARHVRGSQCAGAHRVSLRALRYLEAEMRREGLSDVTRLEQRHFRQAEAACLEREQASSAYRVGQRLEEISSLADQHGITDVRIQYVSSIKKSTVAAIATKMPSTEALEALGDVSGSDLLYNDKRSLILMRIVDLLAATGFRVGEVLSVPENPIVSTDQGIGIRYWPEKGGKIRVKQISSAHRELVERAVKDLTAACADARAVARWCEQHPGRAPLPDGLPETLSTKDIEATGLTTSGVTWMRTHRVPMFTVGRTWHVRLSDCEDALVALRDDRPPLKTGDGRVQLLSECLIVVFRNELHVDRGTNRFVATWVRQGQIADFLGARDAFKGDDSREGSVFKKYGLRDRNGNWHRLTSHQFRHWLSTLAKRGGLSDVELARWMGRKRIADNRAYDHRTQEERVEEARSLIRSGQAVGPVAEVYRSLAPIEAESFLSAQVGSALTTPYGMCLHNYGQGPCERHFACAGCSELLRRKGDEDERTALKSMLDRTRESLEAARAEDGAGTYGASNWRARNERLVIDLTTMLAVDGSDSGSEGDLIPVWPRNTSKAEDTDVA